MKEFWSLKLPRSSPGKVVRAFRVNFKISYAKILQVTGIDKHELEAMESGLKRISKTNAAKLALVLGIDPGLILKPNRGFPRKDRAKKSKPLESKVRKRKI